MPEFYSILEETLASLPRSDIKLVLGDFNAKVSKIDSSDAFYKVVGRHGLGTRRIPCSNNIIAGYTCESHVMFTLPRAEVASNPQLLMAGVGLWLRIRI